MSTVSVVYVGNEDVGKHIKSVEMSRKKTTGNAKKKADELSSMFAALSSCTEQTSGKKKKPKSVPELTEATHPLTGPMELTNTDDSKSAQIYTFKTPKSKKHMAKYAAESVMKFRKKNSGSGQDNQVEKKTKGSDDQMTDNRIPKEKHYSTRYSFRTRTGNNFDLDDESGSDLFDSEEEDITSLFPDNKQIISQVKSMTIPSHRLQLPSDRELYFNSHTAAIVGNSVQTSDRTLQRLKNPRMEQERVNKVLAQHENQSLAGERQTMDQHKLQLQERYKTYFKKWMFSLCNGFNLLLFGLGSKRKLMHFFCDRMLQNHTKLVVNGFFPGLSIKSIVETIVEEVLKSNAGFSNVETQLRTISEHYSSEKASGPLFLIIHNMDGISLRSSQSQHALSRLAELQHVHLIASIDHINAPLIWDQTKLSRFSWLWYDVTTFSSYVEETSYEGSLLISSAGAGLSARGAALALSGLMHVARSLTSNARGVFRFLVEHHLEREEGSDEDKFDLSFSDLYQKCREQFLVNSELTLRAHLTEFVDHRIVQIRKGADGGEYLSVPLDMATLKEYLEQDEFS